MAKQFAFYGTVSADTMQPEDLIPKFLSVLAKLNPQQAKAYQKEWAALIKRADQGYRIRFYNDPQAAESASELCDDLFDALDACAPEGFYFGAHPGDGADYGFWQAEEY